MKKLSYNQYGNSDKVISIIDAEIPKLQNGEVLIKVKAASINPVDWKIVKGEMKMVTGSKFPREVGCDFAGLIEEVGVGVSSFKKGDEVFGWLPYKEAGSFSEFISVKEEFVVKKPSNLSFNEAAALPMIGGASIVGLLEKGKLKRNYEVLINGCLGGVGHIAVQIAKGNGANVDGICVTSDVEKAKELGVSKAFDYKKENVLEQSKSYDLIFDTVGNFEYKAAKKILKKGGKFLNLNPTGLGDIIKGSISSSYIVIMASLNKDRLEKLASYNGNLKPIIGKVVAFENSIETISSLEKGERISGKVIIEM